MAASHRNGTYEQPIEAVFTLTDNRPAPLVACYTLDGRSDRRGSPIYVQGNAVAGPRGPACRSARRPPYVFSSSTGRATRRGRAYYNIGPVAPLGDFREETIYFVITTRFYDGDPSNNFFCRDRIRFDPATGEAIDPHWRGDFGLIQRLDYIRDLGFTAIWITPPVENRSGLDYHGYHRLRLDAIDPRLESPDATYQDLINERTRAGSGSSRTW